MVTSPGYADSRFHEGLSGMRAGNGCTGSSPPFQRARAIPLRIAGVARAHAASGSARVTPVRTNATSVRFRRAGPRP
jgi:hypothetical protein